LDLRLSLAQQQLRERARAFAEAEVVPVARQFERGARLPSVWVARLAELGWLGASVPVEYGGGGLDPLSYALLIEELSVASASLGALLIAHNSLTCEPLARFAGASQKRAHLEQLARGRSLGCAFLGEPLATTPAERLGACVYHAEGSGFRLEGSAEQVINAPVADLMLVIAEGQQGQGCTAFLVSRDTPGCSALSPDEKLGLHAAPSAGVRFERCLLEAEDVVGAPGAAEEIAQWALEGGRIALAAQAVGIARAAYEQVVSQLRNTAASALPRQAVQFMLADMSSELDAARLLCWQAAWQRAGAVDARRASAIAKLYASEMSHRVCHRALQILGLHGYTTDYDIERHYRDSRSTELHGGTSEDMRALIARSALEE
jgi:butyryl-CoA dehydrogenase